MSIEDPRLSSIDNTSAADEFDSAVEQHLGFVSETEDGIEVAQAETSEAGRADRLFAQAPVQAVSAGIPTEVTPDERNFVTLPAGIELDNLEFEVDGENLVLILADGTEIVVLGGAANIPTFVIGDLELPQAALFAALEGSNINVAAGQDGTFTTQGAPDASRNLVDNQIDASPEDFALAALLEDTSFGDEQQTGTVLGADGDTRPTFSLLFTRSGGVDEDYLLDGNQNDGVNGGSSISGSLGINWGSDDANVLGNTGLDAQKDRGVGFTQETLDALASQVLTSDGVSLVYALSDNGTVLTAYKDIGAGGFGERVFVASVSDAENGSYTFQLIGNLDHQAGLSENKTTIQFPFTAQDSDGSKASSTFSIIVNDDSPVIGAPEDGSVNEDDLTGKSEGPLFAKAVSEGDSAEGSLAIRWGADNDLKRETLGENGQPNGDDPIGRTVSFTGLNTSSKTEEIAKAIPGLAGLSSDGFPLSYRIEHTVGDDGKWNGGYQLIAFKSFFDGPPQVALLMADEREPGSDLPFPVEDETIFVITLDPTSTNGSYTFELKGNLDHYQAGGDGPIETVTEVSAREIGFEGEGTPVDVLDIEIPFTAADSDGDSVDGRFTIRIEDDAPTQVGDGNHNALVDEDDVAAVVNVQPAGTDGNNSATVTGQITKVNFGADGFGSLAFSGAFNVPNENSGTLIAGNSAGLDSGLTSDGDAVFFRLLDGGLTIEGFVPGRDGELVFTATLNGTDRGYTVNLLGNIDHQSGTEGRGNAQSLNFDVRATDGDGDYVDVNLSIRITDDAPVSKGTVVSARVLDDEAQGNGNDWPLDFVKNEKIATGVAGALFTAGADGVKSVVVAGSFQVLTTQNGFATPVTVTWGAGTTGANGVTTFTAKSAGGVTGAVLEIGADGSYKLTLNAPVVHDQPGKTEENETLSINFTVTDGDGDTATGQLQVRVNDDTPDAKGLVIERTVLDDEAQTLFIPTNLGADLVGDVSQNYKEATGGAGALFAAGADGVKSVSVSGSFDVIYKDANGFAQTTTVSWGSGVPGANGLTTFTAVGAAGSTGGTVTGAVLEIRADGSYKLTMMAPVAHGFAFPGIEEDETLSIRFTVTDGDNDTSSGWLKVLVNDDTPTPIASVELASTVLDDEAQALFAGNEMPIDGIANVSIAEGDAGSLFSAGADGVSKVSIFDAGFKVIYSQGGFAKVESVEWSAGQQGAGGATTFTATGKDSKQTAAVWTINADGSYKFELKAPVAHDNNSATEENKTLSLGFTVTDGDGDAAAGYLKIRVNDDAPTLRNGHGLREVTVTEGDTSTAASYNYAMGNNPSVRYGADGFGSSAFTGAMKLDVGIGSLAGNVTLNVANGPQTVSKLTSDGKAVTFELVDSQTIQGYVLQGNGQKSPVVELKLVGSTVTTTLLAPLDHIHAGTQEAIDKILIDADMVFKDGDGDAVTSTIRTTIVDGQPSVDANATVTLDDDALAGGIANGTGDVSPDTSNLTGILAHNFGPDGAGSIAWLTSGNPAGFDYEVSGTNLLIKQAGITVITVSLDASGHYTVVQNAPVKHADGADENTQSFTLTYRVTDGDKDFKDGTLKLEVNDDTPTIYGMSSATNLLANGNFTSGNWPNAESWGNWAVEDIGWKVEGTADGQSGVRLERVSSGYLGLSTSNDAPMVDLGATPGNIAISQTITGLADGKSYALSFEAGSSSPDSAGLEVYWNGVLVNTVRVTGSMKIVALTVVANGSEGVLTFKEIGTAGDNTGTYLANVSLQSADAVATVVNTVEVSESDTLIVPFVEGVDFGFGADNGSISIGVPSVASIGNITLQPDAVKYVAGIGFQLSGSAFDALGAGEIAKVTIPYTLVDGDGDKVAGTMVVMVTGTNHPPTLSTVAPITYTDTSADDNFVTATGTLQAADVDFGDSKTFGIEGGVPSDALAGYDLAKEGTYGTLYLKSGTGEYSYVPDDAAIEGVKDDTSEDFTFTVKDGSNAMTTQVFAINVVGVNDTATITGGATGTVTEDGTLTASGQLEVGDRDTADVGFATPVTLQGTYGSFTFNTSSGEWTYELNNSAANVQALNAGQIVFDKVTIKSADGSASTDITVTINGQNEPVSITVNENTSSAGRYAFTRDSANPSEINFNLSSLFNGTGNSTTYSFERIYRTDSDSWLTLPTVGAVTGNPDSWQPFDWDGDSGLYIYQVTATTPGGATESSYVAFSALEYDAIRTIVENNGNNSSSYNAANFPIGDLIVIGNNAPTNSTLNAGGGHDVVIGNADDNAINGGDGDDAIYGMGGNDLINGGDGVDFIDGGAGNDTITGGAGNDVLLGGAGNDTFNYVIGDGSDIIVGGSGADSLAISGTGGSDTLSVLVSGNTITQFNGSTVASVETVAANLGGGADTLSYTGTAQDVAVNLSNGTATGFNLIENIENVTGGSGDDTLIGNAVANTLIGGNGDDVLIGGAGADTLTGGLGSDTFRFGTADSRGQVSFTDGGRINGVNGYDTVTDFTVGVDKLKLPVAAIAASDTGWIDGTDSGRGEGSNGFFRSHSISNGIIRFDETDTFANPARIVDKLTEVGMALDYLRKNNFGAGATVAFHAEVDDVKYTFVYQQGGTSAGSNHTFVALQETTIVNFNEVLIHSANDPIILDLDRNGFDLSSIGAGVMFDINADGHKDQVGWTSKDGILAYDVDGNGLIDNGSEIFTPDFNGGKFASGVAALASLDANGDGKIDAGDAVFKDLKIWVDANNNGISDEGELSSLTDHHVSSISLTTDKSGGLEDGQTVFAEGEFTFADGSTGNFLEVGFDTIFGSENNGLTLHGGMGEVVMTGRAGADTFVFDETALDDLDVADVITDFSSEQGDVLDVTALLDSLLGEQPDATVATHVQATLDGNGNTTVSVQAEPGVLKDVVELQNHEAAIKVLFDDKHVTVTPND